MERVAAIDLGEVRVGLALSDELGALAHPRPPLDPKNTRRLFAELCALVQTENVGHFLVGLPRHLDGTEGTAARRARSFARALRQRSGVRVSLVDEWLTTVEAQKRLQAGGKTTRQTRQRIDGASAAVLLQSFLDGARQGTPT